MFSYNYISNEMPRELIEVYNDLQIDIMRIIARNLKAQKTPSETTLEIQTKIDEYLPMQTKVAAVIFKDSEVKSVKANEKIFNAEAAETAEALTVAQADLTTQPLYAGAVDMIKDLNSKISINSSLKYATAYMQANALTGINNLKNVYRGLIRDGLTIYESFGGGKTRSYSIENMVRRNVISLVNKSNAEIDKNNFKRSSAVFVEVSSHPTARTATKYMKFPYEDHSSWQGKVYYSRDKGAVDGYEEFESTCGYGEMLGICGINCYHQFQMNYTGESNATQYDKDEVEKQYELSQKQRAMERAIRQLKQSKAVWEEAGESELAKRIGGNIRQATTVLKNFCERHDLKYYNWRTKL